jgi:hypothetical protein
MLLELLHFSQLYSLILFCWDLFIVLLLFAFKREYLRTLVGKLIVLIAGIGGCWFLVVSIILNFGN